jgi:hypothetical protein
VEVAITYLKYYYDGYKVVVQAISCDPLLIKDLVLEVNEAIEIQIPFPDGNI